MLQRELLDARRALRSVSEGVSGPRSKKQRGEWEMFSIQDVVPVHCIPAVQGGVVGSFNGFKRRTQFSGTAVMELETGEIRVRVVTPLLSWIQFVFFRVSANENPLYCRRIISLVFPLVSLAFKKS